MSDGRLFPRGVASVALAEVWLIYPERKAMAAGIQGVNAKFWQQFLTKCVRIQAREADHER